MRRYLKYFNRLIRLIISGNLQNILFRLIGLSNFINLVLIAVDHRGNQRAKKNILCIERSMFERDVNELSHRIRKYGWIWLKKSQITVYQTPILPKRHLQQTEYFEKIQEAPQKWEECIRRSKILIKRFQKEKNICALMLGNIDYWQDYTLRAACKELSIPVLVLQKEYPYNDLLVDKELNHWRKFNYIPNVDAIMVFGKRMKEGYSRLSGLDANKVFVTGAPRIDRWRSIENSHQSNDEGLLIMSFMWTSKELFLDMLIKISKYFKKENLGKITVKCRDPEDHRTVIYTCKKEELENVDVVKPYAQLYDLVSQSKAVIGFKSLATIESMLSVKPILIPDWFIKNEDEKLFNSTDTLCQTAVRLCENEQDLFYNLDKIFKNASSEVSKECINARKEFIGKFWEYDDRITASSKVQNVIDKLVEKIPN